MLTVQTLYPGASPETVEREVTKRIEEALNTISGVRHISSTTTEGLSAVVVEFRLGTRINNAQQDAQAKINAIRADFPKDMKEPVIQRIDFNAMPIVSIAVESRTADIKTLSSVAEKLIKKRIETVAGRRAGEPGRPGAPRDPDPAGPRQAQSLRAHLRRRPPRRSQRENMDVPAGKLEQGRQEPLVRVAGKFRSVESFDRLIVANRNGSPIYLPMVARVVDGIEDRRTASLIDGRSGLSLDVVKQSGANTVEVADAIEQRHRRNQRRAARRISGCAKWWTVPPSFASPWKTCR